MNIVNDKVTEYIANLYKAPSDFLKILRENSEKKGIPIISRDAEKCIINLMQIKKPRRILEIGTAVGYSAICFATVFPETEIVTLEFSERMFHLATENVSRSGLSGRIQIILGDAVSSLNALLDSMVDLYSEGFDLVFIDASKGHYQEFWDGSIPLCREGAIIISDNVLLQAKTVSDEYITERRQKTMVRRMRTYLAHISGLKYVDTAILSVSDGIAVSVLKEKHELYLQDMRK